MLLCCVCISLSLCVCVCGGDAGLISHRPSTIHYPASPRLNRRFVGHSAAPSGMDVSDSCEKNRISLQSIKTKLRGITASWLRLGRFPLLLSRRCVMIPTETQSRCLGVAFLLSGGNPLRSTSTPMSMSISITIATPTLSLQSNPLGINTRSGSPSLPALPS